VSSWFGSKLTQNATSQVPVTASNFIAAWMQTKKVGTFIDDQTGKCMLKFYFASLPLSMMSSNLAT